VFTPYIDSESSKEHQRIPSEPPTKDNNISRTNSNREDQSSLQNTTLDNSTDSESRSDFISATAQPPDVVLGSGLGIVGRDGDLIGRDVGVVVRDGDRVGPNGSLISRDGSVVGRDSGGVVAVERAGVTASFKAEQDRTRKRSSGYLGIIEGLSRDHQKLLHLYVKKGEDDVLRELLSRPDVDINGLDEHNQAKPVLALKFNKLAATWISILNRWLSDLAVLVCIAESLRNLFLLLTSNNDKPWSSPS
jgi:hypothetical protein